MFYKLHSFVYEELWTPHCASKNKYLFMTTQWIHVIYTILLYLYNICIYTCTYLYCLLLVNTHTVWTFLTKALEFDQQNTGEFDRIAPVQSILHLFISLLSTDWKTAVTQTFVPSGASTLTFGSFCTSQDLRSKEGAAHQCYTCFNETFCIFCNY